MEEESPTRHHPHHLSSLVVRPTDSGGGGSDYEPGEVHRDPPPYSPPSRYNNSSGHVMRSGSISLLCHRKVDDRYRSDFDSSSGPRVMHAGSVSPFRHRNVDDRYRPDFDNSPSPPVMHAVSPLRHRKVDDRRRADFGNSSAPHVMRDSISPPRHRKVDNRYRPDFNNSSGPRGRGFGGGRGPGRFRDFSPHGRGRGGGRPPGRDFAMRGFDRGPFRNQGMIRNSPNVAPREGDWICSDPLCVNLNFARRDSCNKCHKPRSFGRSSSPQRNYPGPPRFSGPALDRSPVRGGSNGYRSPPHGGWGREAPRDIRAGPSLIRPDGRFPDHHMQRERQDYPEEDYRERGRFDRPVPLDWEPRDLGRDNLTGRRGNDARNGRRPLSPTPPPLPPPPPPPPPLSRDRWARDGRERSRSPPMMGGPPKDHPRDSFIERGRGPRWGMARDRFDDRPY